MPQLISEWDNTPRLRQPRRPQGCRARTWSRKTTESVRLCLSQCIDSMVLESQIPNKIVNLLFAMGNSKQHVDDCVVELQRPDLIIIIIFYYSRAYRWVIHQSMSLKYEPFSEPLHISAKYLTLHRELYRTDLISADNWINTILISSHRVY